jgi:hypothetical protein
MSDTKVLTPDGTQHLIDKIKSEKESTFRYTTMPTASADNLGQVVQYLGETTSVAPIYTNGYFYKCVAQGTDPETYAWEQTDVQPTSEGDERIKPEITEMGVIFDDGFRPYYNVNLSTIVPSFSELTLSDLAIIMDGYYSGEIPLNALKEAWSVGDSISIDISAMSADGVGELHPMQTVDLTIVDFDKHTLATPIDSITRAGLVLGFQLAEKGYYHSSANTSDWGDSDMSGGWEGCARRTWCNSTLFNAMPNEFQNMIKPVIKSYDTGVYRSGQPQVYLYSKITDKIFIPSINEYIGRTITNAEADNRNVVPASVGSQYNLYKTQQLITDNAMTSTSVRISGGSGANTHFYLQLATPLGGASYAFQNTNQIIAPHVCI